MKNLKIILCMSVALVLVWTMNVRADAEQKQTIHNSTYVSFAPDGKAWTTNAGDQNFKWYDYGTTVTTGISSSVRGLQTGEHYYLYDRTGEIPIGKWKVGWGRIDCCHNAYPPESNPYYHGIFYTRNNCYQNHYSGWRAYCADCGQEIENSNIYMSKEAAESIDYFEVRTDMDYFYLCPFCNNLEQGVSFYGHRCRAVSRNQYRVVYDANTGGLSFGGYMSDSYHMYDNATEYEGMPVTPVTCLTLNSYTRIGYEFVEWNTEPDGSGQGFRDGGEILNLTDKDCKENREEGTVTLYAQWRKSSSTLQIHPNGGSYEGRTDVTAVTDNFGSTYKILNEAIKAPEGHTVSFRTNGGSAVSPITGTRHFTEWSMMSPFNGKIVGDSYYFIASDGNVDTIMADYEPDPITLPDTAKAGSSFGGWYYDPECTIPAGGPGDTLIPSEDMTLYAGWVDLKLFSTDNYTANGGKGAVDLSWTQPDNNNKTFKVYQSRDNATNWKLITSAKDIGNQITVSESFGYSGSSKTYTVPYSGIYTLTAYGAQGSDYGTRKGGYGGGVTAQVWLQKGEKITYTIGGESGFNGGGAGSVYGNGGGSTTIVSNRQGTLLIAGGGGSASASGSGGAGGSSASLRADNVSTGATGQAGGGAGHVGGNAGELIVHSHTASCYMDTSKDIVSEIEQGRVSFVPDEVHGGLGDTFGDQAYHYSYGTKESPIAVDGCDSLKLEAWLQWTDSNGGGNRVQPAETGYTVYNQDGRVIFRRTLEDTIEEYKSVWNRAPYASDTSGGGYLEGYTYYGQEFDDDREEGAATFLLWTSASVAERHNHWEKVSGAADQRQQWLFYNKEQVESNYRKYWKSEYISAGNGVNGFMEYHPKFRDVVTIPAGTTGIYIKVDQVVKGSHFHWVPKLKTALLSGGVKTICGYTEGQVISSKPAYGGSNYISTKASRNYTMQAGVRDGNGAFSIRSDSVGYLDVLSLKNVVATDYALPDSISSETVTKESLSGSRVKVNWQEPKDKGTDYYHVAESYLYGSASRLCRSNVTKNTLISGIKGYYVLTNTDAATVVTALNGSFTAEKSQVVTIGSRTEYLHVAAVDKAGNIGGTVHIRLEAKDVAWKLYTEQLSITEGDNVYPADGNKSWYVLADGSTPITLQHNSYMDGPATAEYQPNYVIYESMFEGVSAKNIIYAPSVALQAGEGRTEASGLSYSVEGPTQLEQYPYSYVVRTEANRRMQGVQAFTLEADISGKRIEVIPIAGAGKDGEIFYSDHEADMRNSITLIADGEAPVISGLEILENRELINRNDGTIILTVTATDNLSGVKEFRIEIANTDNASVKTYTPEADGSIRIEITRDEPIFSGDFIVTAYAADNVGNETKVDYGTTEFALQTDIERILAPHEPIFKCGESGILTITTWGYADRVEVEFPAELTAINPELNRTYVYVDNPKYKHTEELQFMVPLDAPPNQQYMITVRAYKGEKQLEDYPSLSTIAVDGSVLDELRTRLR